MTIFWLVTGAVLSLAGGVCALVFALLLSVDRHENRPDGDPIDVPAVLGFLFPLIDLIPASINRPRLGLGLFLSLLSMVMGILAMVWRGG